MGITEKIKFVPLNDDQYYNEVTTKNQIYVHHTAGSNDPYNGVLNWWNSTPEKVATAFIIAGKKLSSTSNWEEGEIFQVFNSSKWAHHLGLKKEHLLSKSNLELNKYSIGIEICNWGGLTKVAGEYKTYSGKTINPAEVIEYPVAYRGYKYYHKYSDIQLASLRELLIFLCDKWNISPVYKGNQIFEIVPRALNGENGVWLHCTVRPDKSDCHMQPELISTLMSLK